jgi:hypothetical protein
VLQAKRVLGNSKNAGNCSLHRNDEQIQIINEQENGLYKQKTFSDLKLLTQ